jgi:hypothetical protein
MVSVRLADWLDHIKVHRLPLGMLGSTLATYPTAQREEDKRTNVMIPDGLPTAMLGHEKAGTGSGRAFFFRRLTRPRP